MKVVYVSVLILLIWVSDKAENVSQSNKNVLAYALSGER